MKYSIVIEKADTGYSAYSPDIAGCIATGGTRQEVKKNIKEAIEFHLEELAMENQEIPVQPIGRLYGALQNTGSSVTLEEMEEAVISGACESDRA
ncbi:MAG: type II toxin-antitoxin system HicB family antitoxin [Gammaproteobacteria bacterium]|nr:type II toxin-antitoxin system HicB family antitoxin [Gammaproteobacteria bacterium]